MTDHTPEPWETYNNGLSINNGMRHVSHCEDVEDAARIVACVNACVGISQADLELPAVNERLRALVNACAGIPTEQLGDVKALVEAVEKLKAAGISIIDRNTAWIAVNAALAPFLGKD